jgi:hypothetical protein
VRDTLGIGPGDDTTCALLATIDSPLVRPFGIAVNEVTGIQNLVGLDLLDLAGNTFVDVTEIGAVTGLSTLLRRLRGGGDPTRGGNGAIGRLTRRERRT